MRIPAITWIVCFLSFSSVCAAHPSAFPYKEGIAALVIRHGNEQNTMQYASASPEHVLKYLARYLTGGPISDRRLISDENGTVLEVDK